MYPLQNIIRQFLMAVRAHNEDGAIENLRLLIEAGMNINAILRRGENETSILELCVKAGMPDTIRFALNNRADPSLKIDGVSVLHIVCEDLRLLHLLPDLLRTSSNLMISNADSEAPLELLYQIPVHGVQDIELKNQSIRIFLEAIIDQGVDIVDNVDDNVNIRSTALMIACKYGPIEDIRYLLDHGARIDALDADESTALHYATAVGEVERIQLLLEHGANPCAQNADGNNPLHALLEVYQNIDYEAAMVLIGAIRLSNHINDQNLEGDTVLHVAARYNCHEVIPPLIEAGAGIEVANEDEMIPLHYIFQSIPEEEAIQPMPVERAIATLQCFLNAEADFSAKDQYGNTTLHYAAMDDKFFPVFEYLYNFHHALLQDLCGISNKGGQNVFEIIEACECNSILDVVGDLPRYSPSVEMDYS